MTEKFWLLEPREDVLLLSVIPAWDNQYNTLMGAVIMAQTESEARTILNESGETGDESTEIEVWLEPEYTTCREVGTPSPSYADDILESGDRVIITDYWVTP